MWQRIGAFVFGRRFHLRMLYPQCLRMDLEVFDGMKIQLILFCVGLCLLMLLPAKAEQGCPEGFTPNAAGTPGTQCIPIGGQTRPGEGSGGVVTPPPIWAKRWGAIASDSSGAIGVSSGQTSRKKALKAAIDHCRSKGGTDCSVALEYHDQCAAVAWGGEGGSSRTMFSSAANQSEAEGRALDNCKQTVGEVCKVFYSGCSYPERTQ